MNEGVLKSTGSFRFIAGDEQIEDSQCFTRRSECQCKQAQELWLEVLQIISDHPIFLTLE